MLRIPARRSGRCRIRRRRPQAGATAGPPRLLVLLQRLRRAHGDDVRQTFTEHLEEMTTDGIRHRGVDWPVIRDARAEASSLVCFSTRRSISSRRPLAPDLLPGEAEDGVPDLADDTVQLSIDSASAPCPPRQTRPGACSVMPMAIELLDRRWMKGSERFAPRPLGSRGVRARCAPRHARWPQPSSWRTPRRNDVELLELRCPTHTASTSVPSAARQR